LQISKGFSNFRASIAFRPMSAAHPFQNFLASGVR